MIFTMNQAEWFGCARAPQAFRRKILIVGKLGRRDLGPPGKWTGQQLREAFPLTNPYVTCCGIEMRSSARTSDGRCETWA